MAATFLEPGGDATFIANGTISAGNGFFSSTTGTPALATDFVHGAHLKSIRFRPGNADALQTAAGVCADVGTRISFYVYFAALPTTATCDFIIGGGSGLEWRLRMTTGGVLQIYNGTPSQIGSNGATLSTGQWYRISLAYTVTSTTVNRFELFVDGVSSISITNATLTATACTYFQIGNRETNGGMDIRVNDIYVDNDSSLNDTDDIRVTAKLPISGTVEGFTTQIGSGGSGYGSGHSQQVNERPLSQTNGWSMVGSGSVVTESYKVEAKNVGDIDISISTIIACTAWISASSLLSQTGALVYSNGSSVAITTTSTPTIFTKIFTGYPVVVTGNNVGIKTSTTVTTTSIYECGVIVAYIPSYINTINGLIKTSVNKVNGLAIASVKTWNNLS